MFWFCCSFETDVNSVVRVVFPRNLCLEYLGVPWWCLNMVFVFVLRIADGFVVYGWCLWIACVWDGCLSWVWCFRVEAAFRIWVMWIWYVLVW